jgi:hypothetical protein
MAWFATVDKEIGADNALDRLMSVTFFDDAAPDVPISRKTYTTADFDSIAELHAAVVADGQDARARWLKAEAARTQVPVGTTVPIP